MSQSSAAPVATLRRTGRRREIPKLPHWDNSAALLADPYRFIGNACRAAGSDVVQGRILLQRTLCMTGAAAAELFYDAGRFQREGAAPEPLQATLFGKGGVQGLDGADHLHRKALFIAATGDEQVQALLRIARARWPHSIRQWAGHLPISLYTVAQHWLMESACQWLGIPLPPADIPRRTQQVSALFDSAASGLWRHVHARRARQQTEQWLQKLIDAERRGEACFTLGSSAQAVAWFRATDGALLPSRVAAVELLNLLRPTVAVSVFVVFCAHALETAPLSREIVREGKDHRYRAAFVQEVRRMYPFFPAVAARVREDFDWAGYAFPRGYRAMLDLYGTNHDPRCWNQPNDFKPERFFARVPSPFEFIPQGGADRVTQHRCPGESVASGLMDLALELLTTQTRYRLPQQDLALDLRRLPALPHDRLMLDQLKAL